ncbi:tetratricopeptide repeat-containing sulfotransferase family protein [Rhizobium paknamense]|uniref:Tetratricopeptide (TPR) repeat protein n=1 Tax=Rhizobium paknamense TaxID=1206817 RepID=A0ABU0I864_9HYPH|nr:tetratricopeptide repeat-containing sulfotransferase family protein [Rhizobium paknamense]MDQ0454424.1 tetratricopeptide (TPR) repeat protein [Rhizobium paknamense]
MADHSVLAAQRQKLAPIYAAARQALTLGLDRLQPEQRAQAQQMITVAHKASASLADVAIALHDHQTACELLDQALSLEATPALLARKGQVLAASGQWSEAARHFRAAIESGHDDLATRLAFARALKRLGQAAEADRAYHAVLALAPDHLEALNETTFRALMEGEFEAALEFARRATEAAASDFTAWFYLGQTLQGLGRTEEAKAAYDRALEIDPDNSDVFLLSGMLQKYQPGEPRIATMQALYERLADAPARQLKLGFALFKALDETKQHEAAFPYLAQANTLRRLEFPAYRLEDDLALIKAMRALFTPELVASHCGLSPRQEAPVFITGLPRSGTSLTEQILASHPDIYGAGELESLSHVIARFFPECFQDKGEPDRSAPRGPANLRADMLSAAGEAYLAPLRAKADGRRIADKMPINLLWVGFIRLIFPKAKIVITRRDALANGFAIYSTYFPSQGTVYGYDLADTARYIVAERQLGDQWQRLFPDDVLIFSYEDLTENQEAETRRLLDFCGLPFDRRCLDFHLSDRPVKTLSSAQVRQGMYSGRDRKTQHYRQHLGPMIEILAEAGLTETG